jgi:hypothetical protein
MAEDAILDLLRKAQFAEAAVALDAVRETEPARAAELGAMLTVLQQPFVYGLTPMFDTQAADAEKSERSLVAFQSALRRVAGRITAITSALAAQLGAAAWLPDVTALEPIVDGTLVLDDKKDDALQLLWTLRREWTRLNWLLACAGSRTLALPSIVEKPPEPLDYLDTLLSARFNLLVDAAGETPLTIEDELDRGMSQSRWGGEKGAILHDLSPTLAALWLEETSAAVAAIRWADGDHESPFDGF